MANVYADLPLPVGNGAGAAVNTSTMGAQRTIVVGGAFPGCLLTVEVSVDGAATWAPICSFQDAGSEKVVAVAAEFMRVSVAGRRAGVPFTANVDVSSTDAGGQFLAIPLPAGNGAGPAVNATALGSFQSFVCSGSFTGAAISVEISEDGTSWQRLTSWAGYGGVVSLNQTAFRLRAVVGGRKATVPFTAALGVGAINDPSAGGGITELTTDVLAGPGSGAQIATVVGIQTVPVSAAAPANGDVLAYNGGTSQWEPTAPAAGGITELTGDVIAGPGSGSVGSIVAGIEGVPVDATPPTPGDVLTYNGVWWTPTAPAPTGVTAVTATAPLASTGGATPDISLAVAMSGDVTGNYPSPTVVGLQGNPVSSAAPVDNQVLTWNGTAWVPGSIAQGGSGGGGQLYYLNGGTAAQPPVVGLDPSVTQLGKVAEVAGSSVTSAALPTVGSAVVASFVTDVGVPGLTAIPAGLWDYNVWASSATSTTPGEIVLIYEVYAYDGATATLVATSGDIPVFDPTSTIEYDASAVIPQTAILATDRIYVEVRARAANPAQTVTLYFGGSTPSHIHTTLPSVAGTGIVHVVNGAFVSPASPVDLSSPLEATGTLPVGNGGTGVASAPTNGQLLIGNGVGYTLATITAGADIAVTNGAGSITIATTSGPALWTRTGTVLSPATVGDSVSINSPSVPALDVIGLGPTVYVADAVDGLFFEINSSLRQATWSDPTGPTNATVIDAYEVVVGDGAQYSSHAESDKFYVYDNTITTRVEMALVSGLPTIRTFDGVNQTPLNLVVNELQVNGGAGSSGDVLTSQGAGLPPVWSAPSGGGGRFFPPEQWTHKNVNAAQPATDQSCQVSTDYNTWKAIRNGSITGLTTRLTNTMTAGTLDVTVTINGVPGTLAITHTGVLNTTGGIATQAAGIDTYVAGDLIGINFATDALFAPNNDLESYLELQDA